MLPVVWLHSDPPTLPSMNNHRHSYHVPCHFETMTCSQTSTTNSGIRFTHTIKAGTPQKVKGFCRCCSCRISARSTLYNAPKARQMPDIQLPSCSQRLADSRTQSDRLGDCLDNCKTMKKRKVIYMMYKQYKVMQIIRNIHQKKRPPPLLIAT